MATVYLADDLKHNRSVAIKVLRPELASMLGGERFLREIDIEARLQHINILPLHDSGEADGFLYYVMPYVEGESLRERLDREGQLPVEDALHIAEEITEALSYAHARGVVHRDIKPENILLSGGHALLADFGIAKAIGAAGGDRVTESGHVIGTPAYMSPEQASGEIELDGRSDVYSLACVLYEMLAGEPPFSGRTAQAVIARHLSEPPPSLRVVRRGLPAWLEDVLQTALAKAAADRFPTADSFLQALEEHTAPRPQSRPWRIRPLGRIAIGLGVAVAIAAAIVTLDLRVERGGTAASGNEATPLLDPARIAVLPFDDQSPNQELDHLALVFPEYLIHQLSELDPLTVLPYAAARQYESLAPELRAGTVIEGTLIGSEDEIRVLVNLTDANRLAVLHSSQHHRPRGEELALLDDLTREIVKALREELGVVVRDLERRAGTNSNEAWRVYARGREWVEEAEELRRAGADDAALRSYERADSAFARARSIDPQWVDPIVEQGWVAFERARILKKDLRTRDPAALQRGIGLATRALELDPDNARALDLRGSLRYWLRETVDHEEAMALRGKAEADLRTATEIDPSNAHAWHYLANALRIAGRHTEAKQMAERALEADQFYEERETIYARLCHTSLEKPEWSEVARWCGIGREEFPQNDMLINAELVALASAGGPEPNVEKAWQLADDFIQVSPPQERASRWPSALMYVAGVLARKGARDSAEAVIRQARAAEVEPDPMNDYNEGYVQLVLGNKTEALRLLQRHLEALPGRKEYIAGDWWWAPLRSDPRFQDLIQ